VNDNAAIPGSSLKRQSTLNRVGVIVLLAGIGIATIVYCVQQNRSASLSNGQAASTDSGDWRDDTLSPEDSKALSRDVELYNGKMGMLAVKLTDELKRPEAIPVLIAAISTFTALGCFFVARHE
jgi:hypothetical protein